MNKVYKTSYLTLIFLFIRFFLFSSNISDIYWYNVPDDNIKMGGKNINTQSYFSFCTPSPDFHLEIQALSKNNKVLYKTEIKSDSRKYDLIKINKDIFRVEATVPYLPEPPEYIIITDKFADTTLTIPCKYAILSGHINAKGKSEKYLGIKPDDFNGKTIFLKTDSLGTYKYPMPIRKYAFIFAMDSDYGKNTLENWFYNFQLNADRKIDFDIFNGEIYNLHIWKNKGGGNSMLVTFRPMILARQSTYIDTIIDGHNFKLIEQFISLAQENTKIFINDKECPVLTMQHYYETGTNTYALRSYIVQIELDKNLLTRKANELRITFKKNIFDSCYIGTAKINFDYDEL